MPGTHAAVRRVAADETMSMRAWVRVMTRTTDMAGATTGREAWRRRRA